MTRASLQTFAWWPIHALLQMRCIVRNAGQMAGAATGGHLLADESSSG